MLPHALSEAQSIANAFLDCSLALDHLDRRELDDGARALVVQLEWFMNTAGVEDPDGRGTWLVMAERFSDEEKLELARVIDELAHWFGRA